MRLRSPLILLTALLVLAGSVLPATAAPPVKIGVAYDVAGLGDMAFNDLVAEGAARAEADFGVKLFEKEMVKPSGSIVDGEVILGKLAKKADLVIGVGFLFGDGALLAADQYPYTNIAIIDWAPSAPVANLLGTTTADHEGAFLVGAAAALASETGSVGFLGGMEFGAITRHEAGFAAGARHVDSEAVVDVQYLGTFSDPSIAYAAAMTMYESGVDVIYHAAGGAGYGLFYAARDYSIESGEHVWAIGVDVDQYQIVPDDLKPHVLTSMLKRFDLITYDIIAMHLDGTFAGGYEEWDLQSGAVDYSTSGGFIDDYVSYLELLKAEIIAGNIPVPTSP